MTTTIITVVLFTTLGIALWQAVAWRLWRSATKQIEIAVTTTGQRIVLPMRCAGAQLGDEQRARALNEAYRLAHDLLGLWRRMLLRFALGRLSLRTWIESEIESAILRLKQSELLPSSIEAKKAKDPVLNMAIQYATQFMDVYLQSFMNQTEPGPFPGVSQDASTKAPAPAPAPAPASDDATEAMPAHPTSAS